MAVNNNAFKQNTASALGLEKGTFTISDHADAGLEPATLENRSRIESPRLQCFENSLKDISSGNHHTQSRAAAGSNIL